MKYLKTKPGIKLTAAFVMLLAGVFNGRAQSPDDKIAITAVIDLLFSGMEKGDSAMVSSTFTGDATFATIFRDGNNEQHLHRENSTKDFLKAVGTPHEKTWFEETWDITIQVDGDFAQAWCNYAFYMGNAFSHCGVDAFQLYRGAAGWKIFQIADTRRKKDCLIPAFIENKHR